MGSRVLGLVHGVSTRAMLVRTVCGCARESWVKDYSGCALAQGLVGSRTEDSVGVVGE